jgi:U4/U6 small nuclear ribonucleoprotein PRP3
VNPIDAAKARLLAQQESIRARLAAAKAQHSLPSKARPTASIATVSTGASTQAGVASAPSSTSTAATINTQAVTNSHPALQHSSNMHAKRSHEDASHRSTSATASSQLNDAPPAKRAKVFELDMSVTGPTFRPTTAYAGVSKSTTISGDRNSSNKLKPPPAAAAAPSNPYLAHTQSATSSHTSKKNKKDKITQSVSADAPSVEVVQDEVLDDRIPRAGKSRSRHKEFAFIEPGTFVEKGDRYRLKLEQAQVFLSGRKQGHSLNTGVEEDYYGPKQESTTAVSEDNVPPLYDVPATNGGKSRGSTSKNANYMPLVMEWWDMELLPSKTLKKQVIELESQRFSKSAQSSLYGSGSGISSSATRVKEESPGESEDKVEEKTGATAMEESDPLAALQDVCYTQASLSYSKTAALVQHIVPIKPLHLTQAGDSSHTPAQPTIYLTRKERQRQRKLRRQEKQRQLQDLQAAGLIPAPAPRLTLSNFMQVLGEQAVLDPSAMERQVQAQVKARAQAHAERNAAAQLTPAQRAAKRAQKIHQDVSKATNQGAVHVAIFWVLDLSHPYHRAKVDLNARQQSITGCVIECRNPAMACVVVEGGSKAIQWYKRLMTVRIKWQGLGDDEDDDDEDVAYNNNNTAGTDNDGQIGMEIDMSNGEAAAANDYYGETAAAVKRKFNPNNKCALVWQGLSTKRHFNDFSFQSCESSEQARVILQTKGVEHYWDPMVQHATGQSVGLSVRLTGNDDESESEQDNNPYKMSKGNDSDEEDIVMKDF